MKNIKTVVPDTSVLVDGRITDLIKSKELGKVRIVVHKATIGELEHQANKGKETGFSGLSEIIVLRELAEQGEITLEFAGERSSEMMIRGARFGEIDAAIRELAKTEDATLISSDKVQSEVAKVEGVEVIYLEPKNEAIDLSFKKDLTPDTVSLHYKEGTFTMAKKGKPGQIKLVKISDTKMEKDVLEEMIKEIVEATKQDDKGYFETDMKGASVIQLREFRIAIARRPFSEALELTIVRPIVKARMEDYRLSGKLSERLDQRAEGVVVCGAPGSGKSTFVAALAEHFMRKGKIVKTLESPRDLQVVEEITQYAPLEGSFEKTADILLLVRPDYSIYDEMRKTSDFRVFADLRLSGIGMVGVVHATRPIEAIQRFIGRIDLGMIPQVVDTVIFIKEGMVKKVLDLKLTVKIPYGMRDRDLARPVVEIRDFENGNVEFELYKFGDEVVSVPIKAEPKRFRKFDKKRR